MFFIVPALDCVIAQGRVPKTPADAGTPISAERVFLRTLPTDGSGYYAVWNNGDSVMAQRFGSDDSPQWARAGRALATGLPATPAFGTAALTGKAG